MSSLALPSYSSLCSGMLPEAVLPPSKEHSYAQWLERTYQPRESRGPQTGKTDSLLFPVTAQQSGVSHSLPLYSKGMETVVTCSVSCCARECEKSEALDIQLLFIGKDQVGHQ